MSELEIFLSEDNYRDMIWMKQVYSTPGLLGKSDKIFDEFHKRARQVSTRTNIPVEQIIKAIEADDFIFTELY